MPPGPTSIATTVPATAPATAPATQPDLADLRQGDLLLQAADVLKQSGVTRTFTDSTLLQWSLALIVLVLGSLVARFASSVLRRFGKGAAERVHLWRAVVLNSLAGPLGLFLFMVGLGFALWILTIPPEVRPFLVRLFQLANIVILGWLLYNLVDLVTLSITRWARVRKRTLSVMFVPLTRRTLRVTLVAMLALFAAENVFQFDVKALLAGVGIVGLAVSLAAQDSLKNLFGSIMIVGDQPFAIGDTIKLDDFEGTVEDVGFRSTRLRTPEGFVVTIPNAKVAESVVQNNARRRSIRRQFDLGLSYTTPPGKLDEAIAIVKRVLAEPDIADAFDLAANPPRVALDEMLTDQLRLRVIYWFNSSDYWAYLAHAERINLAIMRGFADAGIEFASSSRTLILTGDPRRPVTMRRDGGDDADGREQRPSTPVSETGPR